MLPVHTKNEVKKANGSIAVRPKIGRLTFLVRKMFNVLLHHAQKQWKLEKDKDIFQLPASALISDLGDKCKSMLLLKDYLSHMVDTKVEWNSAEGKEWTASTLIASVKVVSDGGKSVIEWGYSPHIRNLLKDTDKWTLLNLHLQNQFRSYAALALYEICKRYETSPRGLSNRESPEWWYSVLTGNPESDAVTKTGWYKYFKRDHITPAIAEIQALTPMNVQLIEEKAGRKITQLQFHITIKEVAPASAADAAPPVINVELITRIMGFGFTRADAEDFCGQIDEYRLSGIVEIVEKRVRDTTLPLLNSPAAFFKSAVRHGYQAAPAVVKKSPVVADIDTNEAAQIAAREVKRDKARQYFNSLSENEKTLLMVEFESENEGEVALLKTLRKSGLKSKVVEPRFMLWLAPRVS